MRYCAVLLCHNKNELTPRFHFNQNIPKLIKQLISYCVSPWISFHFFPLVDLLLPSSVTTEPLAFSRRRDLRHLRLGGFFAVLFFARERRCAQVCHLLKHVAFEFPLILLHKYTPHVGQKYTVFLAFELPKRPTHRAQRVLSLRSVFFFFGVTFLSFNDFFFLLL